MKFRELGRTQVRVSEVGIGTWEMSGDVWGKKDDAVSKQAIFSGIDKGANFIDTAAGYGAGHVEELLGQMFDEGSLRRDEVVLSTKIKPENGRFAPPHDVPIEDAYRPEWIRAQLDASLRRLKTDHVDAVFMHTWNKAWDADVEWFECLTELRTAGKIGAIGISVPDEGISDANTHIEAGRLDVVQVVFNVFQQDPIHTLFRLARKHNVAVIARSPFSSGTLVQNWMPGMSFEEGDWRGSWPLDVKPGWLESQIAMTAEVDPVLASTGLPRNVASLRFILDYADVSSVIPGSANPAHVEANMSASDAHPLGDEIHEKLHSLWSRTRIQGTYNGSI